MTARRWRSGFVGLGDVVPRRMTAQALAEFAVVSVVFLSMMVSVVDLALWLHAQNVVLSASQEAATVGSRENASAEQAVAAARNLLQAGLGSAEDGIDTVNVDIGPDVTTADVRGTWYVAPLGPLVPVPVHARTSMLREQFRPGGR